MIIKKDKRVKKAFFLVLAFLFTFVFIPKNIKINIQLAQNVYYDNLEVYNEQEKCVLKNVYENMYIGKYNVIGKWPCKIKVSPMQYVDADNVESINIYYGSIWIGGADKGDIYNDEDGLHGIITYSQKRIFIVAVFYAYIFLIISWCIYKMLLRLKFPQTMFRVQEDQIKLGYITLIYILSTFLLKNITNIIKINNDEILAMGIGLYITLLLLYSIIKDLKLTVFASTGFFVGLYIAVNNMTSFLTVDESRAIKEQAQLSADILRHWELGSSRLNYIVMGSIWKVIKGIAPYDNLVLDYKFGKLLHWICGVALIAILVKVIVGGVLKSERKSVICSRYIIIWCFIMISPTMLTVLKNYNYDLFAVMFGSLAVFTLLNAFKKMDMHLARVAVCLSCLATLEKTIAEPIMIICMIVYVYIALEGQKKFIYKAFKETLKINAYICTISLMCNLYIQHILRGDWFPNYKLTNVLGPLLDLLNKIVIKVFANVEENTALLMAFGLNVFIVLLGAIVIHLVNDLYEKEEKRKYIYYIIKAGAIVVVCTTVIGIIGTYIQRYTYFYPYYKQDKDVYMTFKSATAKIFHYNALNQIQFYAKSCLAMLIVFVNAIPTYISVLLLFVCILLRNARKKVEILLLGIIGVLGSAIPILYGMICMEPNPRYQNLYIIIVTICVVVVFLEKFDARLVPQICTYAGLILTCIEVTEFGPANTGFFPFWNINHSQYNNVEIGKMTIGWYGGWGEDISLAGEKIEKYIDDNQLDYDTVNMYMNYHGSWLNNKGYNVCFMPGSEYFGTGNIENLNVNSFPSEKYDFYVFVRWGCIAGMTDYTVPPDDYEPIITIKRRGAIEVWIYTGDQLEQYFQSILDKKI